MMDKTAFQFTLKRMPKLLIGFLIIALGIKFTIYANLGMNPWGTFHQGLSLITNITFGKITQITGLVIILFSLIFKIYPGLGTILNMIFIGFLVDFLDRLSFFTYQTQWISQLVYLGIGLLLFNLGIYLYLSCGLGAGPRDGLMVGVVKMSGLSVSIIRPIIEGTILIIGVVLGGAFGLGTLVNVLLGGIVLDWIFKLFSFDPKVNKQMCLNDYISN